MKPILPTKALQARSILIFSLVLATCVCSALLFGTNGFDSEFLSLRAPRVFLGVIAGAVLAASGSTLQTVFRNPLADPYILGVSGGAAFGAAVAIAVFDELGSFYVATSAVLGAMIATLPSFYLLTRKKPNAHLILLVGLAINTFAASLITLLKTLIDAEESQALLYWLVGSLGYPSLPSVIGLFIFCGILLLFLLIRAGEIELLRLSDHEASRLGVSLPQTRAWALFIVSLMVGVVVSFTGMIGFVGMIIPHLLRPILGLDQRILLPASALLGGAVLASCDGLSRLLFVFLNTELPVGTITALLGAPVFIWILVRHESRF